MKTLSSNRVMKIMMDRRRKILVGNNACVKIDNFILFNRWIDGSD